MRIVRNILALFIVSFLFSSSKEQIKRTIPDTIESVFVNVPDSIKTSVYWYWLGGNISQDGVVKDLQAMKAVGINRAFIGNIGESAIAQGSVKILSDDWWNIVQTTLKTAGELGIEIGMFNSPGWSQSGGPWVKPNEAMRYIVSSELHVRGPRKLSQKLPIPEISDKTGTQNSGMESGSKIKQSKELSAFFQDLKVIAYPAPENETLVLISGVDNEFITEQNHKPFTGRSIAVFFNQKPILAQAELQVKEAGGFRKITEFEINRTNPGLNVGFEPYSPVVVSFPATTSTTFRLLLKSTDTAGSIEKVIINSMPQIERYPEKTFAKMCQSTLPRWQEYLWNCQADVNDKSGMVNPSSVIDITKFLTSDGTLTWKVPAGNWVILRSASTPTGVTNSPATQEATGLEIDKLSKKNVESHFNAFIGQIFKRIPADDRKSFKAVVMDSYETGGQNYTDEFFKIFKKRYGYDALPFLPVFRGTVVGNPEMSDRFLWDLRRLIADRVSYEYVGGMRELSHMKGLTTWLENYGHWGFPGEFLQYGGQSDEVAGEFWSEGELGNFENRAASSCGHIYGKNRISAESFTCAAATYSRFPANMKPRGDRSFAQGINHTLLCLYVHQPYDDKIPGINPWYGNEFHRHNTWFNQGHEFIKYLKRCNFMLQQGLNVADVAYFIGEDTPKMTGIQDPPLPGGYQFDYINGEIIQNKLSVKNGLLTLPHGTSYKILVLPRQETMRPELLKKIMKLVNEGAVVMGDRPKRSPSLQNQPMADTEVQSMANKLWGKLDGVNTKWAKFGKGMIINGMDLKEALNLIKCTPDCYIPENIPFLYNHRTLGNCDIYFISNQSDKQQSATIEFRLKGLQPELWNATNGTIRNLQVFTQTENGTNVPIQLEPYESAFVVFRHPGEPHRGNLTENFPLASVLTEITTPWKIDFQSKFNTPASVIIPKLQSLSTFDNDSIKYFSGTATYSNAFVLNDLPQNQSVFVDLNALFVMAKVSVNGQYLGCVWTAPYCLDISKVVKKGSNTIKVEVVNTWVNRIIGDQQLPEEQRKTWLSLNLYKPNSPLQQAGLIGPVVIKSKSLPFENTY